MSYRRTFTAMTLFWVCLVLLVFSFRAIEENTPVPMGQAAPENTKAPVEGARNVSQVAAVPVATVVPASGEPASLRRKIPPALIKPGREPLSAIEKKLFPANLSSETPWRRWSQVRAIAAADWSEQAPVLAQVSGYYLVSDPQFNEKETSMASPFVVFDERTLRVGVVTGVLKAVVPQESVLEKILGKYHLQIEGSAAHLHLYFLKSDEPEYNLKSLQEKLSAEPGVESVALEILERQYGKR